MYFTRGCVFSALLGICFANYGDPNVICNLPADSGLCYAYFPMFFYDAPSGDCINFIYGGCGGNENKFWTKDECLQRCGAGVVGDIGKGSVDGGEGPVVQEAVDGEEGIYPVPGPVHGEDGPIVQGPVHGEEGLIVQGPVDGGKGQLVQGPVDGGQEPIVQEYIDDETEAVVSHVHPSDICNQENQPGNCGSQIVRYYFDKDSRKCERFMYTGCGGNDNNFVYKFECERTCPGEHAVEDICSFDKEPGPCRAFFPRFYFSKGTGQCEQFIFGGCQGNHNNFKTKEECLSFCTSGKGYPLP